MEGIIFKKDLVNQLQMLVLSRPDLAEAITLIAIGAGLGDSVKLPIKSALVIVEGPVNRLNGGDDED